MMGIKKKIELTIAFAAMFIITGGLVLSDATLSFDKAIQNMVFSMRMDHMTIFLRAITYLANWQTVAFICLVLLIKKETRLMAGVPLALAAGFSTIFYHVAKALYDRSRPEVGLHLIEQGGLSFPSGHAMTGLVFYGLILFTLTKDKKKNKAEKALFFGIALVIFLIGFSRVYLGVHYPTDILGGWFAGASILTLAIIVIEKKPVKNRRPSGIGKY